MQLMHLLMQLLKLLLTHASVASVSAILAVWSSLSETIIPTKIHIESLNVHMKIIINCNLFENKIKVVINSQHDISLPKPSKKVSQVGYSTN